ncbi:SDR family oxidoreductase [Granulicella mallensis]|jgi:NAD(P)-dependent dehydrogenase (short-subunit alcohol dehydrogenase family)|uniref:NAD(P)-dependent dehydrogenase (Short-subunit alcohol dehydrogenase family) n=1 Tax=Granulicella mallensis TaxID=940614 RepID=A0A7W8EB39_9BACT|nr:SDR family oxidoreductase [Granulicella mallensis]MBB5065432.1 NAD(P)-dependent dehydrogenase (short-subunit alcohol dehydrogenase family) [Granulicella mallensis]
MRKTVLITGTSSGIGLATVKLFAENDWNVVATMRNPAAGGEFAGHNNVLVVHLDVKDLASIERAVVAGIECFGRIDVLINNAGYGQYGLFEALSREDIQEQFDVNVFGVMDVTRALLPHFRRNKGGLVLNVGSGAGLFALPMISLYCASKFALEGFSEALAYELASQNIVVKLVEPHGGVNNTNFSERSAECSAKDDSLTAYDGFVERTQEAFGSMTASRTICSGDVAKVIFEAVTDGTDRLRYLVGDDARGFIRAWDEMSNADYVQFMRSKFSAEG